MFKCKFIDFCCLVYIFRFTNQYDNKSQDNLCDHPDDRKNQINRIFRAIVQLVCKYASIFEGIFA